MRAGVNMKHSDFVKGTWFRDGDRLYLCTDVGSRTIVAILRGFLGDTSAWGKREFKVLNASLAMATEQVFDESDIEACQPAKPAPKSPSP